MRITDDVIVIGGGAAGVLFVAHLARLASRGVRVTIVDDGPGRLGSGTAYRTADEDHLLNVRAAGMSAWVDQPDHFVSWLAGRGTPARPGDFVPRGVYGSYLAAVANDAASGPLAHIRHVHARAVDVTRARPHWQVRLGDGSTLAASHVVLASGVGAPAPIPAARRRPRYVADPWRPRALDGIDDGDTVLLIGTGLTAIDIATTLGRTGRRITAVSRHGLVPAGHTVCPRAPMRHDAMPATLPALRRYLHGRIVVSLAATGDWRPAVDGVRPHAQRLWRSLDHRDRREFLRHDRRRWEAARHRMAPRVATAVAEARASDQLTIATGDATPAIAAADAATWIVNATGPDGDLTRSRDPLLRALFAAGTVRPGPLAIGLATRGPGHLLDGRGNAVPGLWTLGCTRRGDLWETTAIPEIRTQAQQLAEHIDRALAPARDRVLVAMQG